MKPVASKEILKGEKLTASNITAKRPGTGIPPKNFGYLLGKIALKKIKKDELIKWGSLL